MNQPLTIQDLARLLEQFLHKDSQETNSEDSLSADVYYALAKLKDWIIAQDTNINPHRYPSNYNKEGFASSEIQTLVSEVLDDSEEKPDAFDESNDLKDYGAQS